MGVKDDFVRWFGIMFLSLIGVRKILSKFFFLGLCFGLRDV